jgi:hypothetical protein
MLSYQVADGLFLVHQELKKTKEKAKPVEVPTNHILVIDVSGSMYSELPKIREQLKKKLPKLIGVTDTVSIIWFSGRGQFGTLLEAEPVATLTDLQDVNKAIDRWLQPIGLTGFKEPLQEVAALIKRVSAKRPGSIFSLFFMSDGCDNQWNRAEILKTVEEAAGGLSAATFVEYGYYADRPLLTSMAEKAGGQLIFAEHFTKYEPVLEASLGKKLSGAPKVEVKVSGGSIGNFVYTLIDGELTAYAVEGGKVQLPSDVTDFWRVSPHKEGKISGNTLAEVAGNHGGNFDGVDEDESDPRALSAAYAAVSLYSVRMKSDVVFPFLKALADVDFIERFSSCFGKQKYSDFMDSAKAAAFDEKLRYTKGWDPKKVPDDDAYTVLDLLALLASDESAHILLEHPEFKYSKIGRSRIDADEILTPEEQKKVDEIRAKLGTEKKASELARLNTELTAILNSKPAPLKFVADPAPDGYPISSLVYNEDFPNISINVRKTGVVDLSARLKDEFKGKVPASFQTFIFRNYAIVKDGLVNVESLPVRVTEATAKKLSELLPAEAKPTKLSMAGGFVIGVINLRALPVINRRMIKAASAMVLFLAQWELETSRAAQKVYKDVKDEKIPPKKSPGFVTTYGEDAANWLKEQGFTDYSGFAPPHTVSATATDFYVAKKLEVAIAGLSKLPSVNDVRKKISASKKQTTSGALLVPALTEVEKWLASDEYTKLPTDEAKEAAFITWIDKKAKEAVAVTRTKIREIAQIKFAITVGQVWFTEFSSLDENSMTLKLGGADLLCKVDMKEVEIKI